MVINGQSEDDMLGSVTEIRVRNNDLWMGILAIALKADPVATKALIKGIVANDKEVAEKMGEVADEDSTF